MSELIFAFCFGVIYGVIVGGIGVCIWEIDRKKRFWRKATLGMTDFDIKCMNEEYARRKSND
jgi:hypothetical protein